MALTYQYTSDRTQVFVTDGAGLMQWVPWTNDPAPAPDIAANRDFQRLREQAARGGVTIEEPDTQPAG